MNLLARIRADWKAAGDFHREGVTLSSLLLYPLRRRLPRGHNQLTLKSGITLVTPPEIELTSLFYEVWVNCCYAPSAVFPPPTEAIVDIGAHVGVFTTWAAVKFPGVRILALEPAPESFEILRQNVSSNRLGQVELIPCACAGRGGVATFYSRGSESMNTLCDHDILRSTFRPISQVPVLTLNELFEKFGVERCGLLKMDCEGAEYEILMSAPESTLRSIRRIALEYHLGLNHSTPEELARFLDENGFQVSVMPPCSAEDGYLYATLRG